MVCGERDAMVPRMNAMALATMFETAGAALDVHWHPGGHEFGQVEMNVTAAWLTRLTFG